MYRSHTCGELKAANIGNKVTIAGWVQTVRDKGTIAWIDIRDRYGLTQVVAENGVKYNADGDKIIRFEDLTKEEKRDRVFFVDDMPYIRKNGELFAVEGLVEDNIATSEPTPPGRPTVITEPKPIKDDGLLPTGTVEVETGEYYKIQLVAVSTYKPYKYESLKNLGAIQLESTVNSYGDEIQRVMLTPFQTLDEAKNTLGRIVDNPRFERAYIVKYVDGTRVRHSKIRLASFRG